MHERGWPHHQALIHTLGELVKLLGKFQSDGVSSQFARLEVLISWFLDTYIYIIILFLFMFGQICVVNKQKQLTDRLLLFLHLNNT